jgi:CTP synthase
VSEENIISNPDVKNIYEIPLKFEDQKFGNKILAKLNLNTRSSNLKKWKIFVDIVNNAKRVVKIGIVGKYVDIGDYKLPDSYVSVLEAIRHAAAENKVRSDVRWINAKDFEKDEKNLKILKGVNGIIVPGGFGSSGVEGKIKTIRFARENKIPYLGLCYGLQLAVVEFARNVCKLTAANTTEIDSKTKHPVIDFLPWQKKLISESKYGATMRLGGQVTIIKPNTLARKLYGKEKIIERFRHRYEINPKYIEILEKNGFVFSGEADKKFTKGERVMQIGELKNHPFFIGSQFHPEFTSRPMKPNPLFDGLIKACVKKL